MQLRAYVRLVVLLSPPLLETPETAVTSWQRSSTYRCDPEVSSCIQAADEYVCPVAPPSGTTSAVLGRVAWQHSGV